MAEARNPSYNVVEMVREKISTQYVVASDTEVARAMGVSRAAVSAYKAGRNVMSIETLLRANKLLNLPDAWLVDFSLDLLAEDAKSDDARRLWKAVRKLVIGLQRGAGTKAAAILLTCMGALALHSPRADAAPTQGRADAASTVYYDKFRQWLRRWLGLQVLDRGSVTAPAF